MKPERQIADIYHDILAPNDGSDAATVRVIRDLDHLYASAPIPATPSFNTLLATRARAASLRTGGDGAETEVSGSIGGRIPPRSRSDWLRQGFAFAGAAIAFALVAAVLVLLFRESDEASTPGAQPDASPTATTEAAIPVATNSDQIAFTSVQDGNPEIYLINADGSGLTRLTNDPAVDSEPAWSPDGSQITFTSDRDGEQRLYVMNADGSDAQLVTDKANGVAVPVWSPDGEWIAFVAFTEAGFLDIFIVHPDGSDLRQLSSGPGLDTLPAWSPTSEQIVYQSDAANGGMPDIVVVNIDGTGQANLTNDVIPQSAPRWSASDSTPAIAFAHSSKRVDMGDGATAFLDTIAFYYTTLQGGNPFRPTEIIGSTPRWSPDGLYLAFKRPATNTLATSAETLHILQANGLETGRIAGIEGAMLAYDWSPDGQTLSVVMSSVHPDGSASDDRTLWVAVLDGSAPVQIAGQLDHGAEAAWRPDASRAPEPSKTPPDLAPVIETPTPAETPAAVTPNALDNLAPLQPGQERHFVFDISADYRLDESGFLTWNVKGSERMLPDGTLQQYMIARDATNTIMVEYVNDGERWWWNQRGWIESGSTASGVVSMPEELRTAYRALATDEYEQIDDPAKGDTHITRYQIEDMSWIGQQLGISVESAYYEVYTAGDPVQVTRTRLVLVTPDDEERQEFALADISFTDVVVIPAEDGPGNYVVPDAPAEGTLQYTPPATLPAGLTIDSHYHDFMGGLEWLTITSSDGISITGLVYPSRGSFDTRPMERRAHRNGGMTVATEFIAGGNIAWTADEANGWPSHAIWDDGRYRIELDIGGVTSREQWDENDLTALISALAGEAPE